MTLVSLKQRDDTLSAFEIKSLVEEDGPIDEWVRSFLKREYRQIALECRAQVSTARAWLYMHDGWVSWAAVSCIAI
jgi:hypothetical protein